MKALSPEELQELRKDIACLGIPNDQQDELICLVDSIVASWVDQAFGLHPVQLSLFARANYVFAVGKNGGIVEKSHELEADSLGNESRRIPENPEKQPRP